MHLHIFIHLIELIKINSNNIETIEVKSMLFLIVGAATHLIYLVVYYFKLR